MNNYFKIGDEVIGKLYGRHFTVTGIVTEMIYIDPLNGVRVEIEDGTALPAYWLDDEEKTGENGGVIYQLYNGASLYKKHYPGMKFDELMSELNSPVEVT